MRRADCWCGVDPSEVEQRCERISRGFSKRTMGARASGESGPVILRINPDLNYRRRFSI